MTSIFTNLRSTSAIRSLIMLVACLGVLFSLALTPAFADNLDNINNDQGTSNTWQPDSNNSQDGQGNWQPDSNNNQVDPKTQGNQGNQGGSQNNNLRPSDLLNNMRQNNPSNEGQFLKHRNLDQNKLSEGYQLSNGVARTLSYVVGWLLGLLVALLGLVNLLGLFYVVIPIGFLRRILSGGRYGQPQAMAGMGSGMMGGMGSIGMGGMGGMGRFGMSRMGGMGMNSMGMGGMGMGSTAAQAPGGGLSNFCIVPASAIQAVNMAEAGERGGVAGGQMGMFNGQQNVGGSGQPINPVAYYLKAQGLALFLTAVAIVLLVLSSVFFDTGIDVGNAVASFIGYIAHAVGLS